jgi:hypothetical protein
MITAVTWTENNITTVATNSSVKTFTIIHGKIIQKSARTFLSQVNVAGITSP